jgi:hypothetical protein
LTASRRLVLTRSPGLDGISDGATTMLIPVEAAHDYEMMSPAITE